MEIDTLIKNAKVVSSCLIVEADVAIKDGKFVSIATESCSYTAEQVIDARGSFVLPGIIDEHCHTLDLGMSELEDFITGSTAAAIGGVTTVLEMPLTIPPTITARDFEDKKAIASTRFLIDFALYGGVVPGNQAEIPKMVEAGAIGFKGMMAGSVPGLYDILDDGSLMESFKVISQCKSIICLHAENEAIINHLEKKLRAKGRNDIQAYFMSRPIISELEAVSRAIMLAEETRCPLHFAHISSPQSVQLIQQKKAEGQNITCETCPQYLVLNQGMDNLGPYIKFAPPARSKSETQEMWELLSRGDIETLGSDHGPHTKENKEKGWKNIWDAGNGSMGIETMLPIMLSEGVNKGRISIQRLVALLCENPARRFGIYPRKGTIQVGSEADIVIVDMEKEIVVKAEMLHSKHKHTPYDYLSIKGVPILTMVRGEVIVDNGDVMRKPGYGEFVVPQAVLGHYIGEQE
ncbi:allantoinase AllB [Chloroflexota bacterium]